MKYNEIGSTGIQASRIALGMMRASAHDAARMQALLETALELGINYIDHADIYAAKTPAEVLYGEVMKNAPELRDKFYVQTKCGICQGYYDSSYEHIIESVDQSLSRMNIDHIDLLLLHRPDALMEPEKIAKAFDELQEKGKVRHFGVSNMNPAQIANIKRCVKQDISVDQVQMSIVHAPVIDSGIFVNMAEPEAVMREGSLLDYAQCSNMTIQAWSVVQASWAKGSFLDNPEFPGLNAALERIGEKYGVTKSAVAVAWILRHPAKIQAIAGTANPEHLREIVKAAEIELTRPEWYELYLSAGRKLP